MGQQQLILLVLATIIVGLAIIVGIRAYTENSNKANVDSMMQAATRIANDAQSWAKRPQAMGGPNPGGVAALDNVTFNDLGYPTNAANEYVTTEMTCTLDGGTANQLTIDCAGLAANEQDGNVIEVVVTGLTDATIDGNIVSIEG